MNFKRKERGKTLKYVLVGFLGVAVVAALVWILADRLEGEAPVLSLDLESRYLPGSAEIPLVVSDEKSGLRRVYASILQGDREVTLVNQTVDPADGEEIADPGHLELNLRIDAVEKGLKDGEALLRIAAWDRSWRQRFAGNLAYKEVEIVIDSTPPRISVLTRQHNLQQGGAGLVVYRLSEPCKKHGVRVGDNFFPGYSGYFDNDDIHLAFFALEHDQNRDTDIRAEAYDRAGNRGQSGFPHYIQNRSFPSDNLNLSDHFMRQVLPEFYSVPGFPSDGSRLEQFLFVNQDLRRENDGKILSLAGHSDDAIHWAGDFMALPRAQRMAGFGDHRTYIYEGKTVDHQVHLGVDLASLRHAPVPAANSGRVMRVDWVGIYGNTVVIDHGAGVLSLYSHLSSSDVSEGEFVARGDIIGQTGTTGLAVGDHLHFSMIVGGVFVNPYEWWDARWIENNIAAKLERAAGQVGR